MLNVLYYIIAALVVLILSFTSAYLKVKDTLNKNAIEAETEVDTLELTGKEKMQIVIQCLMDNVPFMLKFIFTKQSVENLAQATYDQLKRFWQQRDLQNLFTVQLNDIEKENQILIDECNVSVSTMLDAICEDKIVPLKGGEEDENKSESNID